MRGFTPSDVSVTNGSAVRVLVERTSGSSTTGDPNEIYASKYAVDIQPAAAGLVTVSLPAGKVFSAGGEGNSASNSLTYNYMVSTVQPRVLITEPVFDCEATGNGFCVMVVFHHRARDKALYDVAFERSFYSTQKERPNHPLVKISPKDKKST